MALAALAAYACKGDSMSPSPLSPGAWGGDHISMTVTGTGAHLEFDCAHAEIPSAITLDRLNQFDVAGTYVREHGGPIRLGEIPDSHPAEFVGLVASATMTLTIRLSDINVAVGAFTLVSGSSGRVFKCL